MNKNILIIGPARSGKTTLAKMLVKEYGYSLISIDNLVSGFEAFDNLNIHHDDNEIKTAKNIAPFLIKYLTELSEGNAFYDGVKYVIEGTHIDFEMLLPFLKENKKYKVIGLTYNDITPDILYQNMKKYDTEDDWTYWCSDEELRGNAEYFIKRNSYFSNKFKEYDIKTYDVSENREQVLARIVKSFKPKKFDCATFYKRYEKFQKSTLPTPFWDEERQVMEYVIGSEEAEGKVLVYKDLISAIHHVMYYSFYYSFDSLVYDYTNEEDPERLIIGHSHEYEFESVVRNLYYYPESFNVPKKDEEYYSEQELKFLNKLKKFLLDIGLKDVKNYRDLRRCQNNNVDKVLSDYFDKK